MRIVLPCHPAWQKIPLHELAWTFIRCNPRCPPAKFSRSNDRLTLVIEFPEKR